MKCNRKILPNSGTPDRRYHIFLCHAKPNKYKINDPSSSHQIKSVKKRSAGVEEISRQAIILESGPPPSKGDSQSKMSKSRASLILPSDQLP